MNRRAGSLLQRVLTVLLIVAPALRAQAGGLFVLDRGSRPLARGGAFVAGVDDPHALWFNPAGLGRSGNQLVADFTLTFLFASFQRLNTDGEFSPAVAPDPMLLPIPTLALSHRLGLRDFTFGAGIFAPNTLLLNWPRSIPAGDVRAPGPTRYSLLSLKGSVLANLALGFAYHGIDGLSLGADLQVSLGRFKATNAFSATDGLVCTFPEDPACDVYAELDAFPVWGISAVLGFTYSLADVLIWGASVSLPYTLRGAATLDLTPPSASIYDDAYFSGDQADFGLKFPTIIRVGSELRPAKGLRMEGAFVWEQWSRQQTLEITPSEPIFLRDVVGITDYQIGPLELPRKMRNTWSLRGGFEFFVPDKYAPGFLAKLKLILRGGLAYERSAFSKDTTTPMTLDSDKVVLSGGSSLRVHKKVRLEGTIGYVFMKELRVRSSDVYQPTAIRPSAVGATPLGNGNYDMDALLLGGALSVLLE